ncbi:unnamed protein product [Rangifer tarandus platyrhynchus]|uniref:Uncharacterized protein n=1 Tax=Rangifer tarandus platyrhynchus TaxID=3082113 RepID=A0AC59Y605_RANTA
MTDNWYRTSFEIMKMLGNYILVTVVQLCAIAESYAFSKGKFCDVSYLNFYSKRLYIDFKKSFKIILLFVFWLCWVFVAAHRLLLVVVSRGCSSLQCMGFSLQWLLVEEHGP